MKIRVWLFAENGERCKMDNPPFIPSFGHFIDAYSSDEDHTLRETSVSGFVHFIQWSLISPDYWVVNISLKDKKE